MVKALVGSNKPRGSDVLNGPYPAKLMSAVSRFVAQTKVVVLLKTSLVYKMTLAMTLGTVLGKTIPTMARYPDRLSVSFVLCRSPGMEPSELLTPCASKGRPKNANVTVLDKTEKLSPNRMINSRKLKRLIMIEGSESKTLTVT